ncbi:MAG: diacylglycerol/lipid kinase family protein [Rhodothermales bacterium]
MRTIAILNPAADSGSAGKKRRALEAALRAAGVTDELWLTQGPGHAVELARRAAAEADVVLAVGGDGTIHEVSQGLIESEHDAHLGVIPLGTGNDFVKMIGMPLQPEQAVRLLAAAQPKAIDYGLVRWVEEGRNGRQSFINAVGIGFDAMAASHAIALKFLPGITGYLAAVLRTLRHWDGPQVRILGVESINGSASLLYEGPLLLVTAGNGVSSGGMFYLTPHASITDGLLDVCIVEHAGPWRILRVIPQAIKGRHEMAQEVHTHRVHTLTIAANTGLPIHADGEILAQKAREIDIEVISGGLSVLTTV